MGIIAKNQQNEKSETNQSNTDVKVSIVIPAYNEQENISNLLTKLRNLYPNYEIIVVDDGSTDNTVSVIEGLGLNIKLIRHPYNIGNGAAVKTGIRKATGDIIVLMDADGQHAPELIPKLLEESNKYDLVVGARDMKSQASLGRRIANWCYNKLASYVTNYDIQDLTSGFRVFHKNTVMRYLYLFPNTFSYPATSTLAYLRSGLTIKYVPIYALKRKGKSKIRIIQDGFRFFLIIIRIATLFSPLKIFIPISLLFCFLGFFYYLYTYLSSLRLSIVSPILISVGIMIFLMGLISEQITQLRYDRTEDNG